MPEVPPRPSARSASRASRAPPAWLAGSRGYEWVQAIRLDLVTIDGRRVRYFADAFHL